MKKILFATCLLAGPVFAQECPIIENDIARLACYDAQTAKAGEAVNELAPVDAVENAEPSTGKWVISSEISAIDDSRTHSMYLESNEVISCRNAQKDDNAILFVRCQENTTAVYLSTRCHVTDHAGYGVIDYRFGSGEPGKVNADASTDNRALGLWRGGSSIPFIKKMLAADTATLRFTPFSDNPITVIFDTSGLDQAVIPLRKECGW